MDIITHLSIALCILQQTQQKGCWLHWPTSLPIRVAWFGLGSSPNSTAKPAERNSLLVSKNILQIPLGLHQRKALNCLRCFPSVLKGNPNSQIIEMLTTGTLKPYDSDREIKRFSKKSHTGHQNPPNPNAKKRRHTLKWTRRSEPLALQAARHVTNETLEQLNASGPPSSVNYSVILPYMHSVGLTWAICKHIQVREEGKSAGKSELALSRIIGFPRVLHHRWRGGGAKRDRTREDLSLRTRDEKGLGFGPRGGCMLFPGFKP